MSTTSWSSLTLRQKVALAVCVSAGVTGLYVCYTRYRNRGPRRSSSGKMKPIELQVKVPPDALKVIVGRQGNIRQRLQKQTDACISVSEQPDSNGEYIVTITGSHAQVHEAQKALHSVLQESVLRVELLVPSRCVSRIIGKGGEKIQSIIRSSGAKISCGPKPEDSAAPTSNITIVGTKEQVDAAKLLVQNILEEPAQQQTAKSASFRCRRKEIIAVKKDAQKPTADRAVAQEEKLLRSQKDEAGTSKAHEDDRCNAGSSAGNTSSISKFEVPSPDFNFQVDEYVAVYVSASENPQHFWIQIQGSRSSQLDKLSVEMSEYYKKQAKSTAEIQVGDIVAAPFPNNSTWYRAEVLKFLDNGNVDLYYVDYGDNWATTTDDLFPLRSDFLSLPFQAIECSLAAISPVGGEWTTQALDAFDELSHCAMWKPLLSKICSFPSPGTSRYFEVHLCDPSFDPMLDIRQQLINQGFAVEQKEGPLQGEEETNLSRLLDEVINPQSCGLSSQQEKRSPASEGSINITRSDRKAAAESCSLSHTSTSTATVCLEEKMNNGLEERMSRIKISCNETSPCLHKAETTQSSVHDASFLIEPLDRNVLYEQPSCIDFSISWADLPEQPPPVPEASSPEQPPPVPEASSPEQPPPVPAAPPPVPEAPTPLPEASSPEEPLSDPEAPSPEEPTPVPEAPPPVPEAPTPLPEASSPEEPLSEPEAPPPVPEAPAPLPEASSPEEPHSEPEAPSPEVPHPMPEAPAPLPEASSPEEPPPMPEAPAPLPEASPEEHHSEPEAPSPEVPPPMPEAPAPLPEASSPEEPLSEPEASEPEQTLSEPESGSVFDSTPSKMSSSTFESSDGSSVEYSVSSEGHGSLSSSLDNSSSSSPRGYFYHVPKEMSTCSACDIITISSDSEEETASEADKLKAEEVSEILLSSGSEDDVILVEDGL